MTKVFLVDPLCFSVCKFSFTAYTPTEMLVMKAYLGLLLQPEYADVNSQKAQALRRAIEDKVKEKDHGT